MLQWSDTASEPMAAGLQKPARAPQILRRAFEGQPLQAPTQVLFGANDFYIPVAVLEEIEAHGVDLTLEVVEGAATGCQRSALTSSPTEQGHCSADSDP